MRNPVQMLREQLSPAEVATKKETTLTDEEKEALARIHGELEHQHKGWLDHPITIESLKKLERDLAMAEDNLARISLNPSISDSFVRGLVMQWVILKVNINSIKTTRLILS